MVKMRHRAPALSRPLSSALIALPVYRRKLTNSQREKWHSERGNPDRHHQKCLTMGGKKT